MYVGRKEGEWVGRGAGQLVLLPTRTLPTRT